MGFKRPLPPNHSSSSSSVEASQKRWKEMTPTRALPEIAVFILQAKLDDGTIGELFNIAERSGVILVSSPEDSEVIITGIRMRRRLERHIKWEIAKEKAIVLPDWLRDSVKAGKPMPCGDYVAIQDLHDSSVANCPDSEYCAGCEKCTVASDFEEATEGSGLARQEHNKRKLYFIETEESTLPSSSKLNHAAHYAVERASPLICANQDLVKELAVIRKSRELEGEERSALSYQRAIGALKAYPHRITSEKQVEKLPYIGAKIYSLIKEYLSHGRIEEAREISESERFQSLSLFASIYGIGPHTARHLYDVGLRTIEDLEVYYETKVGAADPRDIDQEESNKGTVHAQERTSSVQQEYMQEENQTGIREGLRLHSDLSQMIPRDEVEEMGRIIHEELNAIETGCISTVVGGYRRGKTMSNDVDIVFTHPAGGKDRGLCKRLVERLREKGMVTHVMHLSSFRSPTSLRKAHWDTLEKSLTVFHLPKSSPFWKDNGNGVAVHRRLDLICSPAEVYWCAIIGWTGSTMFQRDLRNWAKYKKQWKFDSSGMTRRSDSAPIYARSEPEVFELLGLEWVHPTMRNADA